MKYTIPLLLIGQIFISCNRPNLEIEFSTKAQGKAIVFSKDTSAYRGFENINIIDHKLTFAKPIKEPILFQVIIDDVLDLSQSLPFLLSSKPTKILIDTLITPKYGKDYRKFGYKFIKDPNNNKILWDFYELQASFMDSITIYSGENFMDEDQYQARVGIYNHFIRNCDSLILRNNNKLISAVILNALIEGNYSQLEHTQKIFERLSPEVRESFQGMKAGKEAGLKPMTKAPNFTAIDINGDTISINDFTDNLVLLHFWSSTCAPCIEDSPRLIELAKTNKNLEVINVSLDIDRDSWLKGIEKAGIGEMINICDSTGFRSRIASKYSIRAIPAYYLIGQNNKVIVKGPLSAIEAELEKYAP